jgi:hypothetical protein
MQMRTNVEQFAGLEKIVKAAAKKIRMHPIFTKLTVTWWVPDVVTLQLPNGMVIVYATGGYDLWDGSKHVARPDMTFDEAVQFIIDMAASPDTAIQARL